MEKNRLTTLETAYNKAASGKASVRTGLRLGYALRQYDLNRAEEIGLAVLKETESQGLLHQQGWAHRLLGLIATYQGNVEVANLHAGQAMQAFMQTNDSVGISAVELLQALQERRQGKQKSALRLLKKNLKIFAAHNMIELSIEALSAIGGCYARSGNFNKAEASFREAMKLRNNEYTPLAEQLLLVLLLKSRGETVIALEQLQQLYSQAIAEGMMVIVCRILHTIGSIYGEAGNYPAALEQLHNCLSISQLQKLLPITTDAHHKLSVIYKNLRDYPSALHHAAHSLEGANRLGNRYLQCSTLGGIGNIYYPLGELNTALSYYQQALAIAEETDAIDLISVQLENIANVLRDSGDINSAIEYYERGLLSNKNFGDQLGEAHCKFNLGRLYNDIGKPIIAIPYLNEALQVAEEINNIPLLVELHGELARGWKLSTLPDCYQKAYYHLSIFLEQREKMIGQERQREIGRLQQQIATEQSLRQQEQLERKQQEIEQELRHTEEKLMVMGVHLANKNELLSHFHSRLQELLHLENIPPKLHNQVKKIIDDFSIVTSEQEWETFQKKLELVHQGFLLRLSEQFPALRPAELRVCALLRTQLTTKEIASLLNITERGVEKLRYQTRKKMGLTGDQNLSVFLSNF